MLFFANRKYIDFKRISGHINKICDFRVKFNALADNYMNIKSAIISSETNKPFRVNLQVPFSQTAQPE